MQDIDSLIRSFIYAFKGFCWMVFHERNFRIHLTCMGYMAYFLMRYDFFVLTKVECAILVLACAIVLGGEMINSGIEKADDSVSRENRYTIKVSKDVAAGAVLVFAISSVIVGVIILWQPEALRKLFEHYVSEPQYIVYLVASLVVALAFIFKLNSNFIRKLKKKYIAKKEKK